jgi:integrase
VSGTNCHPCVRPLSNGNGNKGLTAEQEIFYKGFLRNLRTFHTELHKLRKTGASRRYRSGVLLMTVIQELGHESLETTQIYLADVQMDQTKKAVADADFVPKPRLVNGTDGD